MSDIESSSEVEEMPIKTLKRKDISKSTTKKRQKQKKTISKDLLISDKLKKLIADKLDDDQQIYLKQDIVEPTSTKINLQ